MTVEQQEAEAPEYMFTYIPDPRSPGQFITQMLPNWYEYFLQFRDHLSVLRETTIKKWTE